MFDQIQIKMKGGQLHVKKNNVFHCGVTFASEGGDIIIGNFNIFEDKVLIYNSSSKEAMVVGDYN